jgi:hypothetical protein
MRVGDPDALPAILFHQLTTTRHVRLDGHHEPGTRADLYAAAHPAVGVVNIVTSTHCQSLLNLFSGESNTHTIYKNTYLLVNNDVTGIKILHFILILPNT